MQIQETLIAAVASEFSFEGISFSNFEWKEVVARKIRKVYHWFLGGV